MIICKNFDKNKKIENCKEWLKLCPPKDKKIQWKDGRSAKELARDWTKNKGTKLIKILNKKDAFENLRFIEAAPEYESKFDDYRNGRENDLLVIGEDNHGKVVVGVEAKADESFGDIISKVYLKGITNRINGSGTKIPNRIEELIYNIFGVSNKSEVFDLKYQLLYGVAGVLSEAKKHNANRAIFLINTYMSDDINRKQHENNQKDLDEFVKYLRRKKVEKVEDESLIGPFTFKKSKYISEKTELYIMKSSVRVK